MNQVLDQINLNEIFRNSRLNYPIYENPFNNYNNNNNINYYNQAFSNFEKQYGTSTLSPDDKWQNDALSAGWNSFLNSMYSTNQLKNFKYKSLNRVFKATYSPTHNSFDQTQKHQKSFNPYVDYPDLNQPVTPQNLW